MHDDFTVRVGLEDGGLLELLAEGAVVVDLAVDGEDEGTVVADEGLSSRVWRRANASQSARR